jgi:aryl-alcohol dehydrogenase-like predicted oxidoreductase
VEYQIFGPTGLAVSRLCLGTMTFGREADEAASHAMLDRFTAAGGTFIDTSNVYGGGLETTGIGNGESEAIIGRWLRHQPRDRFIIATKVIGPMGPGPNDKGLSRHHILRAVEDSLRRLGTDYIDLYQVHGWDTRTPLDETLATLDSLVQRGLVRYLGVNNYTGWQLQKALDRASARGWESPVSLQTQYSLLARAAEPEPLAVARQEGLAVMAWSPLAGGWLTGKYRRGIDGAPAGTRASGSGGESWDLMNTERTWQVLDQLAQVATELERPMGQVALRWVLEHGAIPIVGARSVEQLEGSLGAASFALPPDALERLNAASAPPLGYPYDLGALVDQLRGFGIAA